MKAEAIKSRTKFSRKGFVCTKSKSSVSIVLDCLESITKVIIKCKDLLHGNPISKLGNKDTRYKSRLAQLSKATDRQS